MPNKSQIYGAQFLHRPIRGLTPITPTSYVKIIKLGSPAEYARKVYHDPTMTTSWRNYDDKREIAAWDLRAAYDDAWQKWSDKIVPIELSADSINDLVNDFEYVISTVPLNKLCARPRYHFFRSIPVYVFMDRFPNLESNVVVYNGTTGTKWHRSSWIFGEGGIEQRFDVAPDDEGWKPAPKIVATNCDCHPLLHRAGRLGRWERGVLTHHAYEDTVKVIMGD